MVPYVLGFRPEQSMVMLTFGADQPTFHARVDLPEAPDDLADMVACLLDPVRRHRVPRAVLIAYGDDSGPCAEALHALGAALVAEGVDVVEMLRVSGNRWYPMLGGADDLADGIVHDERSHPFAAQAVLDGRVTHESRDDLVDSLVGTDLAAIEAVESAILEAAVRRGQFDPVAEARWVQQVVVTHIEDETPLTDAEAGRLVVACQDRDLRDVAWGLMSRETAAGHVDLWRDLVRRTRDDLQLVPAALLAFAAWLSGSGALAWCALDRAALIDPDYGMVRLLGQALEQALPPAAWEPVDALPALLDGA